MEDKDLMMVVRGALDGMAGGPKPLASALHFQGNQAGPDNIVTEENLLAHIKTKQGDGPVCDLIRRRLQAWDYYREENWATGTVPNTDERRKKIYELLSLSSLLRDVIDATFPPWIHEEQDIVIAKEHKPWYDNGLAAPTAFYWEAYRDYLRSNPSWQEDSICDLNDSTNDIMDRLSSPWRPEAYQSKGLVVGYVQSGKTAHFTGLIAKAADAGYRLFIILAGTINLLRSQTQRRIDKELIGKEFLEDDYRDDAEWETFVSHPVRPSEQGAFDWTRLTGPNDDYAYLKYGIKTLDFKRRDSSLPFFDRRNLRNADACIMVVKKIPSRLKQVARDLGRIRARLEEIPTLVIDDESDQASLNTLRNLKGATSTTAQEIKKRTATNNAITSLLRQLPRAQYVGYTATPFANVFVDPLDAADLFPKDFIVSLKRPIDYMGAQNFHDLGPNEDSNIISNEKAFVRDIRESDMKPENLLKALDSYILSGAVKIFRASNDPTLNFRHHTMLVHESHLTLDHERLADSIEKLIDQAGYYSPSGKERLYRLWENDFKPVIVARNSKPRDLPSSFDKLSDGIAKTLENLTQSSPRVLVVNGNNNENAPDFDRQPVWKIIVGGTKLSRGYTIEGLTVSYYRRTTQAADTLMQMGRWFGFRRGYGDLVRIFIGRDEPVNAPEKKRVDLYKAFEAVCLDEMEFREELQRYAKPESGAPITPAQVPPLVPYHMLMPTSKNKMFNAEIVFENFGGRQSQSTRAPEDFKDVTFNIDLMRTLLKGVLLTLSTLSIRFGSEDEKTEFYVGQLKPSDVQQFIARYRWSENSLPLKRLSEFLDGKKVDAEINKWLFLAPQLKKKEESWKYDGLSFSIIHRRRTPSGRYIVYTDPIDVQFAEHFSGIKSGKPLDEETKRLQVPHQGVFLFYPVRAPSDPKKPDGRGLEQYVTMGFSIFCPKNSTMTQMKFGVKNKEEPDAIVVDNINDTR